MTDRDEWTEELRAEFVKLLTTDGPTKDRRRREFNQAIFAAADKGGWAVFNGTDLEMVLTKFDRAVRRIDRGA